MAQRDYLEEVKPRSVATAVGIVLVVPVVAGLGLGLWLALSSAWHPPAPSNEGEVPLSTSESLVLAGVLLILFTFFANVLFVLLKTFITGKGGRLVPWWIAWIVVALLAVSTVAGGVVAAIHGDKVHLLRAITIAVVVGPLVVGAVRLRRKQSRKLGR